MFLPALVCLSVCLFVCYHDNLIKRRRIWTNYLGRFLGGKASPSSFLVTIASRVWRLLSKNAVNRGFLRFSEGVAGSRSGKRVGGMGIKYGKG